MDVSDAVVLINDKNPSLDKENTWCILRPGNHPKAGQVFFFMHPRTIKDLNKKTAHELCVEIGERLFSKNSNLRPESFGHFYVCCHFGGGGLGDVYKKTVLLNSALEQEDKKWSFLAISKKNSFPDWLFEKGPTEVKLRSLKKDDLFTNIKFSIDNAAHELQTIEQKENLDDVIHIVEDYITPKNRNSRQHCAIVVGCSCKKSEIEDLYKAFDKKRGTADVFILTNEGVVASTWAGWTGKPLSNECIAHFGASNPNTKVFALSVVRLEEDWTPNHEFFTDWMFAGWIDYFGKENVRFYGKDEDSVKSMMDDLYCGEFRTGQTLDSKDCHVEDWYKYLMFRMKH